MIDDIPEKFRRHMLRARPIEIRPVHPRSWFTPEKRPPAQYSWFRLVARIDDDMTMHRAILAYASDMSLLGTAMLPHGINWTTPSLHIARPAHALWFHEHFRSYTEILSQCDRPSAGERQSGA